MRKFATINESQFTDVLNKYIFVNGRTFESSLNKQKKFMKDISKIFGNNYITSATANKSIGIDGITGMAKLGDFMFLGIEARIEGRFPVYVILYISEYWDHHDGSISLEIRGYVPEKGNTFDKETRRPHYPDANIKCDKQELINDIAKHFYRNWDEYDKVPVIELLD
jgi:hypothetical protein